jgi:general secretion pathway protein E
VAIPPAGGPLGFLATDIMTDENLAQTEQLEEQAAALEENVAGTASASEEQEEADNSGKIEHRIDFSYAKEHNLALGKNEHGDTVVYTTRDLTQKELLEVIRHVGFDFEVVQTEAQSFNEILTKAYQLDSNEAKQLMNDIGSEVDFFSIAEDLGSSSEDLLESEDDAPIIRLINAMLSEAIKEGASDVHVECYEKELVIRFRVDGILKEIMRQPRQMGPLLISRIKVMAKLDIAEKRVPQDGRITLRIGGRAVDVRVSTLPSSHGERVVLRLLDKNAVHLELADLGMTEENREKIQSIIRKPHGIILVTGPTGSGKSTTLYAALSNVDTKALNVMTVEDPIEYDLEGVGQTQVNAKVDMTFARGLRAILRQDPDVVMVGEIRDTETAEIAVQASLTGHLVLSTLHTNTAVGAITRLRDMGIEPFLLSSTLLGVLAQRLVRTLCPECKERYKASNKEKEVVGITGTEDVFLYRPVGCKACNNTGYKGRTGIHELLLVNNEVRESINEAKGELYIENLIRPYTPSIKQDGMNKVLQGKTTVEEVLRVARDN